MTTPAYTLTSRTPSLEWLRNFLCDELAPYPGRSAKVARMVITATIVMLINMTFQIPYGAYGTIFALIISRESPEATLADTKVTVIAFAYSVLYVLVAAMCVADDPVLHLVWVLGSLFLIFFATRAIDYHAAARFGYLLVIVIPLWDREISAEEKVIQTLWAIFAISFASIITAVVELIYVQLYPLGNVRSALVERLTALASLLRDLANGTETPETKQRIARLAVVGTSRLRRDLVRSNHLPETAERMGAVITLVGRLVDLGASAAELCESQAREAWPDSEELADRIEALTNGLRDNDTSTARHILEQLDLRNTPPLLREIENTINLLTEVLRGSDFRGGYCPPPERLIAKKALFAPDAFSNPEYVRFAIRGGLSASACYLAYNLVGWTGISTAVTTCLLTALSTVGSSRQKQILRVGGAVVGGVILGFGAQIFILPALDSIAGFTILFLAVTILAAWISTSSSRLSYFGVQIAVAFYLINLQEFRFQTSLTVARDRVAGIFLGLVAMWCIFDQLWGASAAVDMQRTFVSSLRLLAKFMRAPVAKEPSVAIEETYSLRETIDANFEKLRQNSDAVMLEFGKMRERNLVLRTRLLQWQFRLRVLFILRVALLKYRLRLPGFELPEVLLRSQEQFDAENGQRLENLARLVSGKPPGSVSVSEIQTPVAPWLFDHQLLRQNSTAFPALRSFVALCSRIDSLLAVLEREIVGPVQEF